MSRAHSAGGAHSYQRPDLRIHRWEAGTPRVVIVHDMRILGPALRVLLAERAQIQSQTIFGTAAVALAEILGPDVVVAGDVLADGLIDQFLPGLLRTGARVLLLADEPDVAHGLRLLRQGVSGLVSLRSTLSETADAIVKVAGGEAVVPGPVAESLVCEWRTAASAALAGPAATLTTRELEVLSAMADGMATKAIARRLGIAAKTAENHKTRIFQKLGVRTQAEAVTIVRNNDGSPTTDRRSEAPGLRLA